MDFGKVETEGGEQAESSEGRLDGHYTAVED